MVKRIGRKNQKQIERYVEILAYRAIFGNLLMDKKGPGVALRIPDGRSYANIETLIVWRMKAQGKWSKLARLLRPVRLRMDAPAQDAAFHQS